jgi:putative transposase
MCLSVPPKYSISMAIGYIKGKSAIKIHREVLGHKRQFTGLHFWAPGYCVSTLGLDETVIREYMKNQENLESHKRAQLNLTDFE